MNKDPHEKARCYSVAGTSDWSGKEKADHRENAEEERHIAFARPQQQHPAHDEQKSKLGVPENREILWVEWSGPDDPENP